MIRLVRCGARRDDNGTRAGLRQAQDLEFLVLVLGQDGNLIIAESHGHSVLGSVP
jgi:hypothetical protein